MKIAYHNEYIRYTGEFLPGFFDEEFPKISSYLSLR